MFYKDAFISFPMSFTSIMNIVFNALHMTMMMENNKQGKLPSINNSYKSWWHNSKSVKELCTTFPFLLWIDTDLCSIVCVATS